LPIPGVEQGIVQTNWCTCSYWGKPTITEKSCDAVSLKHDEWQFKQSSIYWDQDARYKGMLARPKALSAVT